MIHTKSLIRRLAYVPWLLAFGLVLGWAGEAQAQAQFVRLSVDKTEVREDGGPVTITVTAKTFIDDENKALGDKEHVIQLNATALFNMVTGPTNADTDAAGGAQEGLGAEGAEVEGFGRRFTMTLPTIVIPKDQKEVAVESVFTPIPSNHENNDKVTTGDNPYKEERIPNEDLLIRLTGDVGGAGLLVVGGGFITLVDTDKPSAEIKLGLNPAKVSKEAERTAVTVSGRLDGARVNNETLSFLLRHEGGTAERGDADRDADYDIELTSLTIPRKKPSGSTTIYITPKNAGTGFIRIGGETYIWTGSTTFFIKEALRLLVTGTDINQDGDTRDEWPARTGEDDTGAADAPGTAGATFTISNAALREDREGPGITVPEAVDYDPDGTSDDLSGDALTEFNNNAADNPANSDGNDPDGDSYWAYSEAATNDGDGWDLNGDGDKEDYLKVVTEKDLRHRLSVRTADFEITETAIAATKGLTATPAEIRESIVGQTEESREVSVKLDIEIEKALPDDARVRFFVRDELSSLPDEFTDGAQAATRGTDYTATVDELTIPAGDTKRSTTLNLVIFDNSGKNAAKIIRVEAKVGTVSKFVGIKITDDETSTTMIDLTVEPGEVKAGTGTQMVTVTGTLNGDVFDTDTKVTLVVDPSAEKAAQRDTDYTAAIKSLTIPAEQTSGTVDVEVTATNGGDKRVWLKSLKDEVRKNDDDDPVGVDPVFVTLKDADEEEETDPGALSFEADFSGNIFEGRVGTAIDDIELPETTGGAEGDKTYGISTLPAGLALDDDTQTISGTPTAEGESKIVYTVIDAAGANVAVTFTIEIAAAAAPTVSVESVEASPSSVRENGEAVAMSITATLAAAAPKAETISFTIGAAAENSAVRDVDYTASIRGSVKIEEGATDASTTLTLTPIDNDETDGNKYIVVRATASGGSESVTIKIADDETASTSISLSANPNSLSESADETDGMITATLDGKVLDDDQIVVISVDPDSEASRDADYLHAVQCGVDDCGGRSIGFGALPH